MIFVSYFSDIAYMEDGPPTETLSVGDDVTLETETDGSVGTADFKVLAVLGQHIWVETGCTTTVISKVLRLLSPDWEEDKGLALLRLEELVGILKKDLISDRAGILNRRELLGLALRLQ